MAEHRQAQAEPVADRVNRARSHTRYGGILRWRCLSRRLRSRFSRAGTWLLPREAGTGRCLGSRLAVRRKDDESTRPGQRLSENRIESRLRWTAASRGVAAVARRGAARNRAPCPIYECYAFSESSLRVARPLLFLCLALAIAFGIVIPLLRLNRRRAARHAETAVPEFDERLLTFAERQRTAPIRFWNCWPRTRWKSRELPSPNDGEDRVDRRSVCPPQRLA